LSAGQFCFDPWEVECTPEDGARLSRLCFGGRDLLTGAPESFRPPSTDCGLYETRPVYGYDDCFPTVAACRYPEADLDVPDHGELCWLPWTVSEQADGLCASVESRVLPLSFQRAMRFEGVSLRWTFEVTNHGGKELPFQHVMHPLMPLSDVAAVQVPPFASVWEEMSGAALPQETPAAVAAYLQGQTRGAARMVLVRGVKEGRFVLTFRWGEVLTVTFPADLFPTLGIWWNDRGYPDEDGCRRDECAFEPVPGDTSSLAGSFEGGGCLKVPGGGKRTWSVFWEMCC